MTGSETDIRGPEVWPDSHFILLIYEAHLTEVKMVLSNFIITILAQEIGTW